MKVVTINKSIKIMKKLLILLILISMFGCIQKTPEFSIGDTIYLMPDSTKMMIISIDPLGSVYTGAYTDSNGVRRNHTVYDYEIY